MLDALGLSTPEEHVYRHLVGVRSGSAESIADSLDLSAMNAAMLLGALEEKGLVARSTAVPGDYVASPPLLALGSLIAERQEQLRDAEEQLERLADQYRSTMAGRTESHVIDVVHGNQAVAQHFAQLQRSAKREVLALVRADVAVTSAEDNVDEDLALARGVQYRIVIERAAFERPGFVESLADSLRAGEEIRMIDHLPLRLLVSDRSLALLPLTMTQGEADGGAFLVHSSGLLNALVLLFDLIWETAQDVPLWAGSDETPRGARAPGQEEIHEIDARILTLLLAGLPDKAIGTQLDMSLRTLQRRISHLMEQARVASRFQLGHEAARRGWIGL